MMGGMNNILYSVCLLVACTRVYSQTNIGSDDNNVDNGVQISPLTTFLYHNNLPQLRRTNNQAYERDHSSAIIVERYDISNEMPYTQFYTSLPLSGSGCTTTMNSIFTTDLICMGCEEGQCSYIKKDMVLLIHDIGDPSSCFVEVKVKTTPIRSNRGLKCEPMYTATKIQLLDPDYAWNADIGEVTFQPLYS